MMKAGHRMVVELANDDGKIVVEVTKVGDRRCHVVFHLPENVKAYSGANDEAAKHE